MNHGPQSTSGCLPTETGENASASAPFVQGVPRPSLGDFKYTGGDVLQGGTVRVTVYTEAPFSSQQMFSLANP